MGSAYFGKGKEKIDGKEWSWDKFESTKGFPIPNQLINWVIGQDKAIEEAKLCIDEWVQKLLWLKKRKWWKPFENPIERKMQPKELLPAGPFLLLLGDAGTGKSLLGRAMANYMDDVYKKHNIKLYDVVSWRNPILPSEPKVSIHPTPKGTDIVLQKNKKDRKKGFLGRWGVKLLMATMLILGVLFLGLGLYSIFAPWLENWLINGVPVQETNFIDYLIPRVLGLSPLLIGGVTCLFSVLMIMIFHKLLGMSDGNRGYGIGGAKASTLPKMLVDNSSGRVPFIDATGHGSAQLFGSVAWDPYQTGGLGTPEHQRVTAGDVHRAHLGILYIDEIKNLTGQEPITLLTVLEDGQLSIALRSQWHGGDTSAMAVSSEPVPCMCFLIAAGNLDSLPHIHPALLDRIQGYGKVVYMNNDMPDTIENRRRYVRFIAQEIKRFHLLPFSNEACKIIIDEARRKSGKNNKLTTKFRPMISIIKTASVLSINEGLNIVNAKHVNCAIEEHCKPIAMQVLERYIEGATRYKLVDPNAKPEVGQVYGMAVFSEEDNSSERVGSVLKIKASMIGLSKKDKEKAYFNVTGVNTDQKAYVQHSILKVRHVFNQLYHKDPATEFQTLIDFTQQHGVEGPSAGVTMTLALISAFLKKPVRQDVAVTGEINIDIGGKIQITPIGGTHEKILSAQKLGFKKVCIPKKNYENDITLSDYTIEVVSCEILDDYIKEVLVNE